MAEAERLWTAETSDGRNTNGRISASWGCVALLEHPERQLPDKVRYGWTGRVAEEGCGYGQLNSAVDEEPAVEQRSGFLNIPWPTPLGGSDLPYDVLLATATNPTIVGGGYPSAQQIANSWNTPGGRQHVDYFCKNRAHRIATFQDREIYGDVHELPDGGPFPYERGLQEFFEKYLCTLTAVDYKRRQDENVINQGLDYLAWLEDHRAEFRRACAGEAW